MSHSKRNTSRAVFTSHERSLAKAAWTVSSARLTRESFLPFASCCLCLEPAQDPVCCPAGDLFCRECALQNLLAQKKEQQRQEKARAQEARAQEEQQARDDAEDEARAVAEFELLQAGLGSRASAAVREAAPSDAPHARDAFPPASGVPLLEAPGPADEPSRKRKFALDTDALRRVVQEDRARARRAIEADRAAAHDATALPSFWTPSETPGVTPVHKARKEDRPKTGPHTVCPAARDGHAFALRTLVAVQFAEDAQGRRTCPACARTLSNASRAVLARPCGHVLCRSCVHQFVRPLPGGDARGGGDGALLHDPHSGASGVRCYVCEADLEEPDDGRKHKKGKDKKDKERVRPGLVELRSEGTGFSAGGASEVTKNGVAFQC